MTESIQIPSEANILVVDDDQDFRWAIGNVLTASGYKVFEAENGKATLEILKKEVPSLILLDYRMPGETGLQVAADIKKEFPQVPVIMVTAYADVKSAVKAMKMGVYDYIAKPVDNNDLIFTIKRAMEKQELAREVEHLRKVLKERDSLYRLMGNSKQIDKLVNLVKKVAPTPYSVLIEGESGTGKELVARAIHDFSKVSEGPFVAVDCGAIPETLIESELFGYMKGAFTGAHADKPGQFELAEGGTIFLDEVGNLSYPAQQKLLRVMQERHVQRLGAKKPVPVNVRIIAATNTSLEEDIGKGRFRSDLYYRLNEFSIKVPPLRERKDDIPYLAKKFIDEAIIELKKNCQGFSKEAYKDLITYHWPGNVRELRNIVRQATLLCEENASINPEHLMFDIDVAQNQPVMNPYSHTQIFVNKGSLKETVKHHTDQIEKNMINETLKESEGNKSKAARKLDIDYKTLLRKIKTHQIEQ